jgi:hypothetical protein
MCSPFGTSKCSGTQQDTDRREYVAKLRETLAHPLAETRGRAVFVLAKTARQDCRACLAARGRSDPAETEQPRSQDGLTRAAYLGP